MGSTEWKEKRTSQGCLCFGGSFNPIHNGHLRCIREIAKASDFGAVHLIPSRQPPHKVGQTDMAAAADRLEMCRLAVAGEAGLEVCDLELRREGPSYTIDTVRDLKRQGWSKVAWLIGADMLRIFPTWHQARELMAEATILVMARPGTALAWDELPEEFQQLRHNVVKAELVDISATEIRQRVRAGMSLEGWVPEAVAAYIREKGLYR